MCGWRGTSSGGGLTLGSALGAMGWSSLRSPQPISAPVEVPWTAEGQPSLAPRLPVAACLGDGCWGHPGRWVLRAPAPSRARAQLLLPLGTAHPEGDAPSCCRGSWEVAWVSPQLEAALSSLGHSSLARCLASSLGRSPRSCVWMNEWADAGSRGWKMLQPAARVQSRGHRCAQLPGWGPGLQVPGPW